MTGARILFVDDEPSLVQTMPQILRRSGYQVTAAGTVNEALSQIVSAPFDVLISDLNIGEPGDGLMVVSAMRRTQPECVTLILTGYPGFETALEAIRRQVDDYLVKPAAIPTLLKVIEEKLAGPRTAKAAANKRLFHLLREKKLEITRRTLAEIKADPLLGVLAISDEERIEHTPRTLEELAAILESAVPEQGKDLVGAVKHGVNHVKYTAPQVATHVRLLERAIYDVIHENLLSLNLSYLIFELKQLNDILGLQLEDALRIRFEGKHDKAQGKEHGPAS